MAISKREEILNPQATDAEHKGRSDQDPAVENLAQDSHLAVGEVKQLYVDEIAKLNGGAHVKGYLSIFALRHVQRMLLNRGVAKRGPAKADVKPGLGRPISKPK